MKYISNFLIDITYKMKDIEYFIKESLGLPCGIQINEMAFATNDVKLGKTHIELHYMRLQQEIDHIHIFIYI